MRKLIIMGICCVSIASMSCGDDSSSSDTLAPLKDSTITQEGSKPKIDSAVSDVPTVTPDGAGGTQTCKQIGECQKACKVDTTCLAACTEKGCSSAKDAMVNLWNCVTKQCMTSCLEGFNATCETCASDKCKTEWDACQNHQC